MSVQACSCEVGLGNVGVPGCEEISKVAKKLIFVPTFKTDGTLNFLDITSTIDLALIQALINQADEAERWFPAPNLENVEDTRDDPITEEANSGTPFFVQEGQRPFVGSMFAQGPVLLGKMQSFMCNQMSAYVVDKTGNLIGVIDPSAPTQFRPIGIQDETFYPRLIKATDTTIQKLQINQVWADIENDANLRQILASEVSDVNFLQIKGLLDVDSVISDETITTFTADLNTQYGSAITKNPVEGLIIIDFTLEEVTPTPGAIVITTVDEVAPGVYDFVFPGGSGGDVLRLTPAKDGFDFTNVIANLITI